MVEAAGEAAAEVGRCVASAAGRPGLRSPSTWRGLSDVSGRARKRRPHGRARGVRGPVESDAYLGRYPVRPGYAYVIWKGRPRSGAARAVRRGGGGVVWSEVAQRGTRCRSHPAVKMNWLSLGNGVPHLHVRHSSHARPMTPGPAVRSRARPWSRAVTPEVPAGACWRRGGPGVACGARGRLIHDASEGAGRRFHVAYVLPFLKTQAAGSSKAPQVGKNTETNSIAR